MSYVAELIERAPAVRRAQEVSEGTLVAFLGDGTLARRHGTVTEAQAAPGAKWAGLAGLPVWREVRSGAQVHTSPETPVLVIQADDADLLSEEVA